MKNNNKEIATSNQTEKLQQYIKNYEKQLESIEDALEESLTDIWDSNVDPISLDLAPYEQTHIHKLINTDNKIFNKVTLVFAALCQEMQSLKEVVFQKEKLRNIFIHLTSEKKTKKAHKKFFAPIKLFGEGTIDDEKTFNNEGEVQQRFGKMMPLLLDISNWIDRCYAVVKNLIFQFSTLYHAHQKLYEVSFKNVHMQTVFDRLADLLTTFVTLDETFASGGVYTNALNTYKR